MIFIELLLILTTFFPLYHLLTALKKDHKTTMQSHKNHSFSILVPCYNESICIGKTIEALKKLEYCDFEVIFINDGSEDDTLSVLNDKLTLIPIKANSPFNCFRSDIYGNFYCIHKPNTGKALSLNEGIKLSKNDIVITLDADSLLMPDCLTSLNNAFCDENVVAAGGAIHIVQAKEADYLKKLSLGKRILIKMQSLDYLKGFFIYKLSLARQNSLAIISGAFGAFRKSVLVEVGGFRKSLGEDIDITIKIQQYIHKTKKRIAYLPNVSCYTECPETMKDLYRQRIRWQKGFIDCIIYHSKFLLSTCLTKPISFYLVFEAICIGVFSCMLPWMLTIYIAASLEIKFAFTIVIFCTIINIFYSTCAYVISTRYIYPYKKKFIISVILDIFFLKPFLSFVYLSGTIKYLTNKTEWKKVERSVMLAETKGAL